MKLSRSWGFQYNINNELDQGRDVYFVDYTYGASKVATPYHSSVNEIVIQTIDRPLDAYTVLTVRTCID